MLNRRRVAGRDIRRELPRRCAAARLFFNTSRLGLLPLLGLGLICACAVSSNSVASMMDGSVSAPWRAGNTEMFQMGMPEENGVRAAQGTLPVRVYRPAGAGP